MSPKSFGAAHEDAPDELMRKLDRVEGFCWRSGQTDAARLLAALRIAVQAADGDRPVERRYLGQLVECCESAQAGFFKTLVAEGAWSDVAPTPAPDRLDELSLRRLSKKIAPVQHAAAVVDDSAHPA